VRARVALLRGTDRRSRTVLVVCWFFRKLLISVASERTGSSGRFKTRGKMCALAGVSRLEPAPRPSRVVKFGLFEVNLEDAELRKSGMRQKLVGQPFEVLRVLLERPQALVTREELQQRIWPKDTFVDYDLALKKAVNRIREVLGDSAESPRFIETVPRQGYRFIANINHETPKFPSLAVLPLDNLSHDPEQEYFAEGLTEALTTTLAKIGDLRVVSRTSAMLYKGARKPLHEIARELEVDMVVEGTVLRVGRRVRITAQLIDAKAEAHLWAESYERDLRNVLAVQSDVARAIAREVQVKLTPQEEAQLAQAGPINPEAYEDYLKGRYYWNRRTQEGHSKAAHYFQQAIAKDPGFAAALAGLADCFSGLGCFGIVPPADGCEKAKSIALQALQMDRSLGETHASLAWATMWCDYDFKTAEREFERSIELSPRYATAHSWFGYYLGLMGRFEEAFTELKRAIRLDPLSSVIQWALGFVYWMARRYDAAIEQFEKTLEFDPGFAWAHGLLAWAYVGESMWEPAITAANTGIQKLPSSTVLLATLGEVYAASGKGDEAQKILNQLQNPENRQYVSPYMLARIYIALGKNDDAFHWLETAYHTRAAAIAYLKVDAQLDKLRSDPRFRELMRRMNFPA
jgi:TolB-like protein/Tfp pilus assembly protein PilF